MGIIKELSRSIKKTNSMKKVIKSLNYEINIDDKEKAMIEFFDCISKDNVLGLILSQYSIEYKDFKSIFNRFLSLGYNRWDGSDYLPVSIFSFKEPLLYVLSNKDAFNNNEKNKNVDKVCWNATQVLKGNIELVDVFK